MIRRISKRSMRYMRDIFQRILLPEVLSLFQGGMVHLTLKLIVLPGFDERRQARQRELVEVRVAGGIVQLAMPADHRGARMLRTCRDTKRRR
jgi:hypothetical protein